jgi:hypothetical protein
MLGSKAMQHAVLPAQCRWQPNVLPGTLYIQTELTCIKRFDAGLCNG